MEETLWKRYTGRIETGWEKGNLLGWDTTCHKLWDDMFIIWLGSDYLKETAYP